MSEKFSILMRRDILLPLEKNIRRLDSKGEDFSSSDFYNSYKSYRVCNVKKKQRVRACQKVIGVGQLTF